MARIARLAQRVGADHAYIVAAEAAQPLAETGQAGECTLDGLVGQQAVFVQTARQPHHVALAIDDRQRVLFLASYHHVKTVRAEVDGRELFSFRCVAHA